jgi:hypothetical protein
MTKARDLANLISGGFTEADIPNLSASKITSGTFADARIAASNVSQHAQSFDDNKLVNDISTLALRQASDENKSAYNTNSSSVDVFQDSTGIDTTTNVSRNSSEYVDTNAAGAVDSNYSNVYFIYEDSSTNSTNDLSGAASTTALTLRNQSFVTTQKKFGTHSLYFASGRGVGTSSSSDFTATIPNIKDTSNLYTLELFVYMTQRNGNNSNPNYDDNPIWAVSDTYTSINVGDTGRVRSMQYDTSNTQQYQFWDSNYYLPLNTWTHLVFVWGSSTIKMWADGTYIGSITRYTLSSATPANSIRFGCAANGGGNTWDGYMDSIRWTNAERYTGTSNITVPTTPHYPNNLTFNSSGNFTGTTITAPSSVSSMGAIITYQDQAGTNALNTDIVLQLSADGGSNYSTATLTALPDFATGIKMAKVNDLSVTAGTQLKYKIEFANQASGSKEARIRGVSLQY